MTEPEQPLQLHPVLSIGEEYIYERMAYLGVPFCMVDARFRYVDFEDCMFDLSAQEAVEHRNALGVIKTVLEQEAPVEEKVPVFDIEKRAIQGAIEYDVSKLQPDNWYLQGLISRDTNPFMNLERYFLWTIIEIDRDLSCHLQRLEDFANQFDVAIENLRMAATQKVTLNRRSIERFIKYCVDVGSEDAFDSILEYPPYAVRTQVVGLYKNPRLGKDDVLEEAVEAVSDGYLKLAKFLEDSYLPHARANAGIYGLPGYQEAYQGYIREYCFSSNSASEIHSFGLNEVFQVQERMKNIIQDLGHTATIQDFAARLRDRKQFPQLFEVDETAVNHKFQDICERAFEATKKFTLMGHRVFNYDMCCILDISPELDESSPVAFLDSHPNKMRAFIINCEKGLETPNHQWEALVLNQLYPGVYHQWENLSQINLEKQFSYFEFQNNKSQGWAEYAESCGEELGFYKDPFQLFGKLECELINSILLVVDTGLHSMGWSFGKAAGYINENAAFISEEDALELVLQCCDSPGKALGPKMGEHRIRKLRAKVEQEFDLNETFCLAEYEVSKRMGFNQAVLETEFLHGESVMEECMEYTLRYWRAKDWSGDGPLPGNLGTAALLEPMYSTEYINRRKYGVNQI